MDVASSSTSSIPSPKYDVFISFRGEDIRKNFLSHLRAAFKRKKIDAYIDDRLKKGYDIGGALFKAIEESRLSVVIFSENYATSKWCLNELLKIVECMEKNKQLIIPVFYKVDPSHVRNQRGSYAKAFKNHNPDASKHKICFRLRKQNLDEKMKRVEEWRNALTDIANLAGFHYHPIDRDENECVEKIARDILEKLSLLIPHDNKSSLVGIVEPIEKFGNLLSHAVNVCSIFVIWGPSGMGKTTIANVLYYKHRFEFEGFYFAANVTEKWEKSAEKEGLRNDLVSHILEDKAKISAPDLPSDIERRLRSKRVLIVVDDVNLSLQIEYLTGRLKDVWFHPGSVIIVTTTNEKIIKDCPKDCTAQCPVTKLKSDDALHLFSFHAFNIKTPPDNYKEISEKAVSYAECIPEALKILGSSLARCENIEEWNNTFKKLKEKAPSIEQMKEVCSQDEDLFKFFQVQMHGFGTRNDGYELQRSGGIQRSDICAAPSPPDTVGLDLHVDRLERQLLQGGFSVIVLTGAGGLGKTTLAQKLCSNNKVKDKFKDNIFFLTFSKTPNLKRIVLNVFQRKCCTVSGSPDEDDVVDQLRQLLNKIGEKPILLVLDDVWPGAQSFIERLIKPPQPRDYKILVTSRFAFKRFGNPYELKPLSPVDAKTLFCQSASVSESDPNIHDEMKQILKGCGGLPLALLLAGGSLRGKDYGTWQSMAIKWSKRKFALDLGTDMLDNLKKLLDVLDTKDDIKECFMDLALFPQDQRNPAAAFIDMWVELSKQDEDGLNNLDEDGMIAMDNLQELNNRNMAHIVDTRRLANVKDKYYNYHFITQHDLLWELAVKQSSKVPMDKRKRMIVHIGGNDIPHSWTKRQKLKARVLSISTGENFNSDWKKCNIEPTEAEVLVLNLQTKNYTFPVFMEKMSKVKVLIVTNYDFSCVEFKNLELVGSLSSLRRMRLEKVLVPFFVQLENLKKLSLFMCNVSQAFESSSHPISNALPNLAEINVDYCNDMVELPNGLCDIVSLKELCITNCHKLSSVPEQIRELVNLEVLRLNSCTDLEELPDSIRSLDKLRILDISYCVSLKKFPENFGKLCGLKMVYMSCCSRMRELPSSVEDLEPLNIIVICDEETAALWEQWTPILKHLTIEVPKMNINLNWLERRFAKFSLF